ncbi:Cointegrate resolution protein T [Pseudomonas coronafaciens pv. coronafaciens]|uniref:hypothetical protein n=1 Tax=Pseudomonas coronafaciens TaxID=53409 RepID=UPI000F008123|nr:hypothetical protein [Pseudomonas coronafaciens]RMS14011.1 Cointegrate resolution protein T [Pseudomonas coronafaciens pv. coronafaciens]
MEEGNETLSGAQAQFDEQMQSLTAQVQALTLSEAKPGAIIEHHQGQVLELREEVKGLNIAAAMATGREADLSRQIVDLLAQLTSSKSDGADPALSPTEPIAALKNVPTPEAPPNNRKGKKP